MALPTPLAFRQMKDPSRISAVYPFLAGRLDRPGLTISAISRFL